MARHIGDRLDGGSRLRLGGAVAERPATQQDWSLVGRAYERRRRPRVTHVQAMTDRLSRAAGLPTWVRDVTMRFAGPHTYRQTYRPLQTPVVAAS